MVCFGQSDPLEFVGNGFVHTAQLDGQSVEIAVDRIRAGKPVLCLEFKFDQFEFFSQSCCRAAYSRRASPMSSVPSDCLISAMPICFR